MTLSLSLSLSLSLVNTSGSGHVCACVRARARARICVTTLLARSVNYNVGCNDGMEAIGSGVRNGVWYKQLHATVFTSHIISSCSFITNC